MIDIAIRNARILDGTGKPAFEGDVEIHEGRIRTVGGIASAAREEIDANGLHLSPGFIDVHSHDDGAFIRYPDMHFKLAQGVTNDDGRVKPLLETIPMKGTFRLHFEELNIGDTLLSETHLVTLQNIEDFAELSGDRFYAHMDANSLEGTIFTGRVAHGYFILSRAAGLFRSEEVV